jgi:hypothetical protein
MSDAMNDADLTIFRAWGGAALRHLPVGKAVKAASALAYLREVKLLLRLVASQQSLLSQEQPPQQLASL